MIRDTNIKVLFDWDAVVRNPYSGFYTFGTNIVSALCDPGFDHDITLLYQKRYERPTSRFLNGLCQYRRARLRTGKSILKFRWIEKMWEIFPFPSLELIAGGHHLYHCFHHFMPRRFKGIRLLTVHDLRRYRLPRLYGHSNLRPFERAVRRADHFICVSNATKSDLCSIFDINPGRVDVVHLACRRAGIRQNRISMDQCEKSLREMGIDCKRFLIAFSSKDRRKNIIAISRAFGLVRDQILDRTALIIIGSMDKRDREAVRGIKSVYPIGTVDDVYPWLFLSHGLVFTSLYEGFGLPIIEAFSTGTPVITSNCSSMPEVAGNAAILVDPANVREIAEAIIKLCCDAETRAVLSEKGRKRLKYFSWEKSARETAKIYLHLCKSR